MREIAHHTHLLSFFILSSYKLQRPTAEAPELISTQNTSNDTVPCKDVLFGVRKHKFDI